MTSLFTLSDADSEGNVPLWEAILNGHKSVTNLLIDNGSKLENGDVGHYACTAVELRNLDLLKEIVRCGGDVTQPKSNGTTALHTAVCEESIDIVKYLLAQGADPGSADMHGWTPRSLADQQGHDEIKHIFKYHNKLAKTHSAISVYEEQKGERNFLGKFKSEPLKLPTEQEGSSLTFRRRKSSNFSNSIFGIISGIHAAGDRNLLLPIGETKSHPIAGRNSNVRVTISWPEKGDIDGKLVLLPETLNELLELGAKKYGVLPSALLTKDKAEIDSIELIRNGDHLVFTDNDTLNSELER